MNGQKLRVIREFRNYSQEHIAARLGISQNAYSRIENNQTRITADRLQALAAILEVPTEELLSEKDPVIQFSFTQAQPVPAASADTPPGQPPAPETAAIPGKEDKWKDEKIAFLENEIHALREERKKIIQVIERLTS